MRIFISHATKNKEVVLKFAEFLESVSSEIEVFAPQKMGALRLERTLLKPFLKN